MRPVTYTKLMLHTALVLLILASMGNIQSHLCLDGQEPLFSLHFEKMDLHSQSAEDAHDDVDTDVTPQGLLAKAPMLDDQLFALALSLVIEFSSPRLLHYFEQGDSDFHQAPAALLPPPRAPPVLLV